MVTRTLSVLFVLGIFAGVAAAGQKADGKGPSPQAIEKAQKPLKEHLEGLKASHGQIIPITVPALVRDFPNDIFFAVRFRQFPVARVLPKGLRASNVFVVSKDDKVTHIRDDKDLEKYFRASLGAVKKQADAGHALSGWLALSQEFFQDGFFKFEILDKAFSVEDKGNGAWQAAGRAIVMQGGNGEINVALSFADGKLTKVAQFAKIRPGPRPICQATKLLDPDPIVRRMAEQDLLIMGVAARDYLQEQRAQAGAELRVAIDRLWQRILREER
jgi:hypothetical protein